MAVDSRLSIYLIRVEKFQPITNAEYQREAASPQTLMGIEAALTGRLGANPFSYEALAKRVGFKAEGGWRRRRSRRRCGFVGLRWGEAIERVGPRHGAFGLCAEGLNFHQLMVELGKRLGGGQDDDVVVTAAAFLGAGGEQHAAGDQAGRGPGGGEVGDDNGHPPADEGGGVIVLAWMPGAASGVAKFEAEVDLDFEESVGVGVGARGEDGGDAEVEFGESRRR